MEDKEFITQLLIFIEGMIVTHDHSDTYLREYNELRKEYGLEEKTDSELFI